MLFGRKKATRDMSIVQIISLSPLARSILLKYGVKFIGKGLSPLESLETVARGNGLSEADIENILNDINSYREIRKDTALDVTNIAAEKLKSIIKSKNKKGIRLRLVSDGCATYVYDMDFATKRIGNEVVFKTSGITFFVETKTADFVRGTKIDYDSEREGFVFTNPNVKK